MKKKIVRSPFFYVGDKYKLIEEISSYFPDDIEKFVEPFVGGGSVFMNIDARKFYLNDIDVNVINELIFLVEYNVLSLSMYYHIHISNIFCR